MKKLLSVILTAISLTLNAQSVIFEMIFEANNQQERVKGYSRMETLKYERSYNEEANIDTTIIDTDGGILGLTLKTKSILMFGKNTDVNYHIYVSTGDTMTITSMYNKQDKILSQQYNYGDTEAEAIFNIKREFSYDNKNRVLTVSRKNINNEEDGYLKIKYHPDGLPKSFSTDLIDNELRVTREDNSDHIKYSLVNKPTKDNVDANSELGKSLNDEYQSYIEVRKKNQLYEYKLFKKEVEDKTYELQSAITRNLKGDIYKEIKYSNGVKYHHKTYKGLSLILCFNRKLLSNLQGLNFIG